MKKYLEFIEWIDSRGKIDKKEIAIDVSMLAGLALSVIYIYEWLM